MEKAWMFLTSLLALYLSATAQSECIRRTCETTEACTGSKCNDFTIEFDGTVYHGRCMRREDELSCFESTFPPPVFGLLRQGRGRNWCKYGKVCKCCIPHKPLCSVDCQNGGTCKMDMPDFCECTTFWTGFNCTTPACFPLCENGGTCIEDNTCVCQEGFIGDRCQFIECTERTNCINRNGTCYDKTDPILLDPTACPQSDNGRNWCSPKCGCCFGA